MLEIYVDGTFMNGMYGGGYVVFNGNDIIYQDCGIGQNIPELISQRNIAGEMTAAMRAAKWVKSKNEKAIIWHDYTGLGHWARKEWKRNNKYTQMYADYMYPLIQDGTIEMKWVKGHSKKLGNDIADRLAKQSVEYNQHWRY